MNPQYNKVPQHNPEIKSREQHVAEIFQQTLKHMIDHEKRKAHARQS